MPLATVVTSQVIPSHCDCRSWTLSPDMTALLDNKARFSDYAASLGLLVPQHHVVTSPAQLRALNDFEVSYLIHGMIVRGLDI